MSQIKLVPAFLPIFQEVFKFNYAWGGRGGSKSVEYSDLLIGLSRQETATCICGREVQKSIKDSVYSLLEERITTAGYHSEYIFTKDEIRHKRTRFNFVFIGVKNHTIDNIKSYNAKYFWGEEAHSFTKKTLTILIPTLRKEGTRFFFSYNRSKELDPIHAQCMIDLKDSRPVDKKWNIDGKIYKWIEYRTDDAIGIYINHDGNPYFPETLEKERLKLKEADYDRYLHVWEGLPEQQGDMCVLSRKEVVDAMERDITDEGGYVLGCDVARFGSDRTVLFLRKGLKVIDHAIYNKTSIPDTFRYVKEMIEKVTENKQDVLINIDDTGLGGGVTDLLQEDDYNVNPVNNGAKAIDEDKFYNVISEMWFYFKSVIAEADIPNIPELLEELTDRVYEYDNKERKKIESKENYKKRNNKSPDLADALLLCYYNKRKEPHIWIV